jgi:hypothetical protein
MHGISLRALAATVGFVLAFLSGVDFQSAAAKSVALVVGNSRYDKIGALANPKRDAAAIADRLRDLTFEVIELFDGDRFALGRAQERFLTEARNADLALVYFAGHGIQLFDRNVLLASDADPLTASRVEDLGLDLTALMARLRAAGPVRVALLIDACRNNPLTFDDTVQLLRRLGPTTQDTAGGRGATPAAPSRGLARVSLPADSAGRGAGETLVLFAAQPGQVSFDGSGQNSYFVEGLREALAEPDRGFSEVVRSASAYVRTVTKGQQVPQLLSDWTSDPVLGRQETAKVRYINSSSNTGRPLTEAELATVGHAKRAFQAFNGTFIVQESQVFEGGVFPASEEERKRADAVGFVNGFAIDYDLDRDGQKETIAVYVRQIAVVLELIDKGVSYIGTPSCLAEQGDNVETVEIALRDINGDRKPEIFIHFRTKENIWGTFCILEYIGPAQLAADRRGPAADYRSVDGLFHTLLRYEGAQSIRIGEDNTIETCSGSNCHTRSVFSFDGTYFRMLLNQSELPTAAEARPFRDQAERDTFLPPAAAARPAVANPASPAAVIASDALQRFVAAYLRDPVEPKIIAAQYGEQVDYYSKRVRRAEVISDKLKYQAKWPQRTYTLIPGSLTSTATDDAVGPFQIGFDYTFRVANPNRQLEGRGHTSLTLSRVEAGFVITREDGKVTERR